MATQLGEVEITVNGHPEKLRCTLKAARTVSALSGGFSSAFEGLARFNFGTYTALIAAGLDKRGATELNALEESVYDTGLESLTAPLTRYVSMLMNGGREPTAPTESASGNG